MGLAGIYQDTLFQAFLCSDTKFGLLLLLFLLSIFPISQFALFPSFNRTKLHFCVTTESASA